MKCFVLMLTAFFMVSVIHAQTAEDSVKATINRLFTGMKNADAAAIKSSFADSAIMQTIGMKQGKIIIRSDGVDAFVQSVSKLPKDAADERIVYETVKIDGPLAIVWTPYQFYYQGKFSHCGVNSFQLVRLDGEWKIQYLIDTRRKSPCNQ